MNVNLHSAASDVFPSRAHVVLHVPTTQHTAWVHILEPGEELLGRTLGDVNYDVESATVAHAHHQFHGTTFAGGLENFVDERDKCGHAFEREALAAQIALLQNLLEEVSPYELIQHVFLIHGGWGAFHALPNPAAPLRIADVHELRAHRAAVHAAGFTGEFAFDPQL